MIVFSEMHQRDSRDAPGSVEGERAGATSPRLSDSGVTVIPLGQGRTVEVETRANKTLLCVQSEHRQRLDIEIRFDLNGPVVTVQAPTLEITGAKDVRAACETFSVDASKGIDLRSGGDIVQRAAGNARVEAKRVDVEATPGAIRLKANDEIQALGEMILLNCDHPSTATPMPGWVAAAPGVATAPIPAPAEAVSGDAAVIAELLSK